MTSTLHDNPSVATSAPAVLPAREVALFVTVALALSAIATGLVVVRIVRTHELTFAALGWNLFLAWLPLVLALMMAGLHHGRGRGVFQWVYGVPWLLLLPNAPYLVTDLVHLRPRTGVPLWFDAVLLMTFAVVGVWLDCAALLPVHRAVSARWGAVAGWLFALVVLALSVVGVYLGRVHRFNSWDVLEPGSLVDVVLIRLGDPLGDPSLVLLGVGGTLGLAVAYAVFWAFVAALRR